MNLDLKQIKFRKNSAEWEYMPKCHAQFKKKSAKTLTCDLLLKRKDVCDHHFWVGLARFILSSASWFHQRHTDAWRFKDGLFSAAI